MPFAARCYVVAMVVAAMGVVASLSWSMAVVQEILVLGGLMAVVERTSRVSIGAKASISVSLTVSFAAMVILPPAGSTIVGAVSGLARPHPASRLKTLFNAAMCGIVLAAGSAVYQLSGGHESRGRLRFPQVLFPFFSAVTVCWFLCVVLLAAAVGLSREIRFFDMVRGEAFRFALPYYSSSVLSLIVTTLWYGSSFRFLTALLVIVPLYVSHWVMAQYSREQAAYDSTVSALVQAVEIKDPYTRGHSERVARGSELIARRINMAEARVSKLRYAGLLHDIGKLSVPTRLLAKTGKLTDEEFEQIRQHPTQGVAVVRDITFLTEVYEGILYHHERLDGRGYPTGRKGDEIPEFARILGVADAFDAMTSTRSYRAARPVSEALDELKRGAGTQFDPAIVRAFGEALEVLEAAGHPWQVTDESPTDEEAMADELEPQAYSFGDHDDPAVELEWGGERVLDDHDALRELPVRTPE